jgi:D-amino-acid dehydrogenase
MVASTQKNVVVVGGGIIGLSSALALLQQGADVIVVDRLSHGGDNCSRGNAGMIVPSHFVPLAAPGIFGQALKWMRDPESPFYIKPKLDWKLMKWGLRFYLAATAAQAKEASPLLRDLHFASREHYIRWSDEGIECSLAKKGLLMLCNTAKMLEEESHLAQHARDLGVPARVLNAEETSALDPNVTVSVAGSVYYPKDCHLDPSQLLLSLRKRILALGGKFKDDCLVTDWIVEGNSIRGLKTNVEVIEGNEFVLSGGIWSEGLVRSLKLNIPMQPGKGYSLTLPNPIELPNVCSILCEAKVAVTPMGDSLRFGGTMQVGELNQIIDPRRVHGIVKSIPSFMPRFRTQHFDGIQPWCGLRPVTPDGLPYIGRTKIWNNLTVATGHAMMGLSLGPITGELVSQLVHNQPTQIKLERLSPDRYAS